MVKIIDRLDIDFEYVPGRKVVRSHILMAGKTSPVKSEGRTLKNFLQDMGVPKEHLQEALEEYDD